MGQTSKDLDALSEWTKLVWCMLKSRIKPLSAAWKASISYSKKKELGRLHD